MTRKVPYSFFNEARYIAISVRDCTVTVTRITQSDCILQMYNFAFVSVVILVPMIVVTNVVANFMVLCLAILFTTTIALGLLFVPKVWYVGSTTPLGYTYGFVRLVARRSEDDLTNMYETEKHRFLYSSSTGSRGNVSARLATGRSADVPSSLRGSTTDLVFSKGDSKKWKEGGVVYNKFYKNSFTICLYLSYKSNLPPTNRFMTQ